MSLRRSWTTASPRRSAKRSGRRSTASVSAANARNPSTPSTVPGDVPARDRPAHHPGHRPGDERELDRADHHQHDQRVAQPRVRARVAVQPADDPEVERALGALVGHVRSLLGDELDRLQGDRPGVAAARRPELGVRPRLDDAPAVQHHDQISRRQRPRAAGHQQRRPPPPRRLDRRQDLVLGLRRRRRWSDRRAAAPAARAAARARSRAAGAGRPTGSSPPPRAACRSRAGSSATKSCAPGDARRALDRVPRRARVARRRCCRRSTSRNRKLSWKTRPTPRRRIVDVQRPHVDAVDQHAARARVEKARHQPEQRALAGARRADDRDAAARLAAKSIPCSAGTAGS